MLLSQTSEDIYLICLCLKKENPVEILLIFCERANCIKGHFAEELSPKYSNTSKPTIKDLKNPEIGAIFNKIEFPNCPKINIIEIQRSVSEKSSDWALKNRKIWKLLTTPSYERSHLAEFSHQQLSQPTVTDVNKICWKYFNRQITNSLWHCAMA